MTRFKVGDCVAWDSQAAGVHQLKVGEVREVVPPNHHPQTKMKGIGAPRDHESYVVRAATIDRPKQARTYWPRTRHLRPCKD